MSPGLGCRNSGTCLPFLGAAGGCSAYRQAHRIKVLKECHPFPLFSWLRWTNRLGCTWDQMSFNCLFSSLGIGVRRYCRTLIAFTSHFSNWGWCFLGSSLWKPSCLYPHLSLIGVLLFFFVPTLSRHFVSVEQRHSLQGYLQCVPNGHVLLGSVPKPCMEQRHYPISVLRGVSTPCCLGCVCARTPILYTPSNLVLSSSYLRWLFCGEDDEDLNHMYHHCSLGSIPGDCHMWAGLGLMALHSAPTDFPLLYM